MQISVSQPGVHGEFHDHQSYILRPCFKKNQTKPNQPAKESQGRKKLDCIIEDGEPPSSLSPPWIKGVDINKMVILPKNNLRFNTIPNRKKKALKFLSKLE